MAKHGPGWVATIAPEDAGPEAADIYLDGVQYAKSDTRLIVGAQDIHWEVFPRIEQDFHGLGDNPVGFPEIESTYDRKAARDEAARCYRCDAETGSFDYNVRTREDIFVMARARPEDAALHREVLTKRLKLHETPYDEHHKAALEDLVFLPANLSRLVIDPYRDACRVNCDIAGEIELDLPFLVGGFDDAPTELRKAIGTEVPTTTWSKVVSVVRRDRISPVRVTS